MLAYIVRKMVLMFEASVSCMGKGAVLPSIYGIDQTSIHQLLAQYDERSWRGIPSKSVVHARLFPSYAHCFSPIFPLLSSCTLPVFTNFATRRSITLFAGNLRLCTLNHLPNSIHVAFKFLLVKKYVEMRNTRSSSEYIILILTCSFCRRSSIKKSLLYRIQCCLRRNANFTPDFFMNFFVMSVFYGTHCKKLDVTISVFCTVAHIFLKS